MYVSNQWYLSKNFEKGDSELKVLENKFGFKLSVNQRNLTIRGPADSFEEVVAEILKLEKAFMTSSNV
jgi:phosphate starvation-inducible protein PhoH